MSDETRQGQGSPATEGLREQRDTFLQTFFRKGAELTEELLRESDRLSQRLAELESENQAMRTQLASADAITELLRTVERLEREKRDILNRTPSPSHTPVFDRRFVEVEEENAKLASLYVASHQLHSTLDPWIVLRHLRELLAQLIGARVFALYLLDDEGTLTSIATEGSPPPPSKIIPGQGIFGASFSRGTARWTEGDTTKTTLEDPAAIVPLSFDGRVVGLAVVIDTFEQKTNFVELDFELFRLVAAQAASALCASSLFSKHGARMATAGTFVQHVAATGA